jgi:rod shape-determining protein MreC
MNRSSIIALVVLGAVLAYFLTFGAEGTRKLQAGFYKVISPFLSSGSGIKKQLTSVSSGLQTLEELEKDNASLKVENRSLKATNQALRDVEHEVNRLRQALAYRERSLFRLVPAEILTRDSSTWWRTITINRGKNDHIEPDQPVVTDEGDNVTIVLLISDENCKVACTVEGTREQGIVSGERVTGSVTPMLDLNFLSKQANLNPGPKVYTSGVGGVFPSGLLVGTIQSFKVRELDGQARVTPAVDLSHLEDVFVVTGRK